MLSVTPLNTIRFASGDRPYYHLPHPVEDGPVTKMLRALVPYSLTVQNPPRTSIESNLWDDEEPFVFYRFDPSLLAETKPYGKSWVA